VSNQRVLIVVGARPNFMKAAPLIAALKAKGGFAIRLIHTGQHFDENMSKVFFDDLGMPKPDVYLGVSHPTHIEQVAHTMLALEPEVLKWKPDLVVVVGDVNSTLAGALVANKNSIRLAHVEAGLRSFDRSMPEEMNRVLVDQIADYLFTPSQDGDENLLREGIAKENIFRVGNIMVDTLLRFKDRAESLKTWEQFKLKDHAYGLVTLHRPSNVDDPKTLSGIMDALCEIQGELALVFPVHPRTRAKLDGNGWVKKANQFPKLQLTPPLGYLECLSLMTHARIAITDSGGVQEETTILGVPCLTVRANTERPITITQGTNRLVAQTKAGVLEGVRTALKSVCTAKKPPALWDGQTAERITNILA